MKVAVVTLATGPYVRLLPKMCQSVRSLFLPKHVREIFVMSDVASTSERTIHIDYLPSMLNSLLRPFYINRIKQELLSFDYVYCIDSDCLVVQEIGEDIVSDNLVVVNHPLKRDFENHFETNPLSEAFVPDGNGRPYFQACFYGGPTSMFLDLSAYSESGILQDLKNRIVAKWHDESHLNKYLCSHPPKVLDGGYAYPDPDEWKDKWGFTPKIIHYNCNSHKAKLS